MGVYLDPNIVPSFVELFTIGFTARIYLSLKIKPKNISFTIDLQKNTFYIYSYTFFTLFMRLSFLTLGHKLII